LLHILCPVSCGILYEEESSNTEWLLPLIVATGIAGVCLLGGLCWFLFRHRLSTRGTTNIWLPLNEIHKDVNELGEEVVLGKGTYGNVVAANFRGIRVAVKVAVPSQKAGRRNSFLRYVQTAAYTSLHKAPNRRLQNNIGTEDSYHAQPLAIPSFRASSDCLDSSVARQASPVAFTPQSTKETANVSLESLAELGLTKRSRTENALAEFFEGVRDPHSSMAAANVSPMTQFETEASLFTKLKHPSILTVLGAVVGEDKEIRIVMELMDFGALHDIIHNDTATLELATSLHILCQVASGVSHMHGFSPPVIHGDIKSRNILLDRHMSAKVADFGLSMKERTLGARGTPYWMAPELLTFNSQGDLDLDMETCMTSATDVYSFGVLMWEVFARQEPFSNTDPGAEAAIGILFRVKEEDLRPKMPRGPPREIRSLIQECWHKNPLRRPSMQEVFERLTEVLKSHQETLKSKAQDLEGNTRILHQVLPARVVESLRQGHKVEPEEYECVTIFFSDIVGFTDISTTLQPQEVMHMLDRLYTKIDLVCRDYQLFKVETIGDAYMCVGGIPNGQEDQTVRVALFAMGAIKAARSVMVSEERPELGCVNIRVGIHTGSVIASVVGDLNPRYCLFGDTVNTASRMESNSEKGEINLSPEAHECLRDQAWEVKTRSRGILNIKGKGPLECFFLDQSSENWKRIHSTLKIKLRDMHRSFSSKMETPRSDHCFTDSTLVEDLPTLLTDEVDF